MTIPHVLIVDDNEDAAETLAVLLEMELDAVSTACAGSLAAARRQLAAQRPQLMFLDRTLPDGQGIDLIAEALADGPMRIVVLTGHADAAGIEQALQRGAAAYLIKPVSIEQLQAAIAPLRER